MIILQIFILFLFNTNELPYCTLKWDYFKTKEVTDDTAAETAISVGYFYNGWNKATVTCTLDKNRSYVTAKGRNQYMLNHEQRHFDIAYVKSKKFQRQINELKELDEQVLDNLYNKILSEIDDLQLQYDTETDNSINKEMQIIWNKKVDKLLNNL